ncbi:MAG: hypothetical protein J6S85_06155 [Methanobrevibacter sp.]|nr:hypothetical protein [Methanobrevibacter sp.]
MLKKLNDVLVANTGLFLCLNEQFGGSLSDPQYYYDLFNWSKDLIALIRDKSSYSINDLSMLDDDYFANNSGDKPISRLLQRKLNNQGVIPYTSSWGFVWENALAKYKTKWDKLWDVTKAQYNPIENYSMTEQEELPTKTTELQHYEDYEITTSENVNRDIHQEENADVERASDVYGFNSPTPVHVGIDNESKDKLNNYIDTNTSGLAEDNFVTESHSKDGEDNKEVTTESYDKKRELTRKGNIGVTTSQQLLESEIALWQWNFIQDVVYKDIDEILCQDFYESEL